MGGENPNTPLSTLGLDFSVFVYLPWKRPHGPGRKWANSRRLGRAGLGNKEPHCVSCRATPRPGPAAGALRGGSAWGPGRKEARAKGLLVL